MASPAPQSAFDVKASKQSFYETLHENAKRVIKSTRDPIANLYADSDTTQQRRDGCFFLSDSLPLVFL
jgi:hypothetical protein